MNKNYMSIIYLAGKFGIVIREHVESLIYTNKYSFISANRTLSKLESSFKLLKRIDRGKRKTDGYKLTNDGAKLYKKHFTEEPKMYNSGDKLQHAIQVVNFYIHIINDLKNRYIIEEINLMEEKRLLFKPEKQLKFNFKDKIEKIVPDSFFIYRYKKDRARVCWLEIENSERKASYVAQKTLSNYERYFLSNQWSKESWQPKNTKIFPYILVIAYSTYKAKQFIKEFNRKIKVEQLRNSFYFTSYTLLNEKGISDKIWFNLNGEEINIF